MPVKPAQSRLGLPDSGLRIRNSCKERVQFCILISEFLILALLFLSLIPLNSALAKKKPPENYAELNFVVLRDEDGKPVRNAAISLHRIDTNGNQTHEGMELKADADGKAAYAGVPYGVLRVQVIAAGFQTWGQDFIINQPERTFTIRLKPPAKQHSIYE